MQRRNATIQRVEKLQSALAKECVDALSRDDIESLASEVRVMRSDLGADSLDDTGIVIRSLEHIKPPRDTQSRIFSRIPRYGMTKQEALEQAHQALDRLRGLAQKLAD